jgi:hypothetical protein
MGKKLIGSGSSKKNSGLHGGKKTLPATVGIHNVPEEKPWVDPEKARAANNAGGAGVMLHKQLKKNKSTGMKPR